MSIDRVAPQAVEAEQSVLGSILIDPEAILKVADFLHPGDFYRPQHADIYGAMLALHNQREPIDLVTLGDELTRHDKLDGVGGPAYLATLMNAVPTAVHVEHYGRIVEQKAVLRNLIAAAGRIAAVGYEEAHDTAAAIDRAEGILFEISQRRTVAGFETLATLLGEAYDRLEYLHEHRGQILGIPTGLAGLDTLLGGFQPSDLVILAARPSMGKTSLALNVAGHVALKKGLPVGIFSLEMSKQQLLMRFLCAESLVDAHKVRTGYINKDDFRQLVDSLGAVTQAPLFIDDSSSLTIMEMRAKARRLKAEHGLSLLIVDYLQLMSGYGRVENRVQEISGISRGLKALAKELEIPVVALSQLSRAPEQRQGDHRPQLSDLRESGSIEQDADVVLFIYREEVYKQDEDNSGKADLIISKQRNGPIGNVKLAFLKQYTKFENLLEGY